MKNLYTKIVLFTILGISLLSCSVTKNLESNGLILRSNKILVNKSEISADSLLPLIVQKKNNYFIGFPVGAKLYESSKKNSDSLFDNWIKRKKNKEKKLNSIFSKKQVAQLKKYVKDYNNWKNKNGEKLEIIDTVKTSISIENLKSFYRNNGYFN